MVLSCKTQNPIILFKHFYLYEFSYSEKYVLLIKIKNPNNIKTSVLTPKLIPKNKKPRKH